MAMRSGGILHRDVSVSNILMTDTLEEGKCGGLLHDFDLSTMSREAPPGDLSSLDASELTELVNKDYVGMDPKERVVSNLSTTATLITCSSVEQGTYQFMALPLLLSPPDGIPHRISHDLESFYWVLLSVVLYHTAHVLTSLPVDDMLPSLFPAPDDSDRYRLYGFRVFWLTHGAKNLAIPGNRPLTALMHKLAALVLGDLHREQPLDYDPVLQSFEQALATGQDWPIGDKAITRPFSDLQTANDRMGAEKPAHHGGAKRNTDEQRRDDVESEVDYDDDADPVLAPPCNVNAANGGSKRGVDPDDRPFERSSKRRKTASENCSYGPGVTGSSKAAEGNAGGTT